MVIQLHIKLGLIFKSKKLASLHIFVDRCANKNKVLKSIQNNTVVNGNNIFGFRNETGTDNKELSMLSNLHVQTHKKGKTNNTN